MSIPKIGKREARDLLRGTTPGPWEPEFEVGIYPALRMDADDEIAWTCAADRDLAIASPDLAQTIAWLYGREAYDEDDRVWLTYSWELGVSPGGRVRMMLRDVEVDDIGAWMHHVEPDEAVDLARALLAAAEEARNGHMA